MRNKANGKNRGFIAESTGKLSTMVLLLTILMWQGVFAQAELSDVSKLIEAYPDSLELHQQFIKKSGLSEEALERQYDKWIKKFPKSATVPFALGEVYYQKEFPAAKPLLLKAIERDSKLAKAYHYLSIDAERWGDFAQSAAYLLKAKEADPNNPDYAFYYAGTFKNTDFDKYRGLNLEVVQNFPESERGAQALYWLAYNSSDKTDRLKFYELLKTKFPPKRFGWASSGMQIYFDLLLQESSREAVSLAQNMLDISTNERDRGIWSDQLNLAQSVNKANLYLSQNKPKMAQDALKDVKLTSWSSAKDFVKLLHAKTVDVAGNTQLAYEMLKLSYAKSPEKKIKTALEKYGAKLNKNPKTIEEDIWFVHDTTAVTATNFKLQNYITLGKTSLSDYKGKVVLLTYWFPGCGPCRGEFPHFQEVVDKFKEQDLVYLGLNIVPEQNDYVVPFMESSGYSFIPLEDYDDRDKGSLENGGLAPVNFMIDRDGKIVYSNFRTDKHSKHVLEEMIRSLLDRNKS